MDKSSHCDKGEHEDCDGSALIFDQDGPSRYICACHCHDAESRERECRACQGTGYVHDVRSGGRYATVPGRLSAKR